MHTIKKPPNQPGCYLFKDKHNRVIYIGKAKNLKKRIQQYQQNKNHPPKTQTMIQHIHTLDYFITDTEVEALVLENTLIKKHQPKYNIRLKDAKSHSYIQLTKEPYPRLLIARRKIKNATLYGPFTSAQERDYLLQFLKKTFTLRTCNKMPKKPCLRHHIHLCDAPCINLITKTDYIKKITHIKQILTGHYQKTINKLTEEMNKASQHNHFETALITRNQITAIEHLNQRQKMQRQKKYNEDIINYEIKDNHVYLMLFNIHQGTLHNKNEFIFDHTDDFLTEFLIQYYSENPIPKELILPKQIPPALHTFLKEKKQSNITITTPQKGEKKQLLTLVQKNIEITFFADLDKVDTLQKKLQLQDPPHIIECFDISHLSGTSTVGSMVQYRNGKPDKNNYRRFRIRTVEGIDDFTAIAEIIKRRYTRLQNEDAELPNLIIIDGGRGQLNSALQELQTLNLKIPTISIAKQFEEIYIPGKTQPLQLSPKDKALHYIQEIRNEAHRFAIKYNRLLRKKELIA